MERSYPASPIVFEHGYPAINAETPLWAKLIGESDDAFNAFTIFLELPEKTNYSTPIRLLPHISAITGIDISQIEEYCHVFYWHWRARAYELFITVCLRKQRESRLMSIEGKHFSIAEKHLNRIDSILERRLTMVMDELNDATTSDELTDDTRLKDLVDMLTKLTELQHKSLNYNLPNQRQMFDGPRFATVEETFKHVAKEGTPEKSSTRRSVEMDALLGSPDDLSTIQNLIVRMSDPRTLNVKKDEGGGVSDTGKTLALTPPTPVVPTTTVRSDPVIIPPKVGDSVSSDNFDTDHDVDF